MSIAEDFVTNTHPNIHLYQTGDEIIQIPEDLLKIELVDRIKAVEQHTIKDLCTIQKDRFIFSDNSQYDGILIEPDIRKYDIGHTLTTPWLTRTSGLNVYVGKIAAQEGIGTFEFSNEIAGVLTAAQNVGHVTLLHDAYVQHLAINEIEKDGRFTENNWINSGYSRGSMVGFGFNALAALFQREVVYSEFVDPCLEHKPNISQLNPAVLGNYLANELTEMIKCASHYGLKDAWHLMKTLPLSPSEMIQHFATMFALFSGEAGQLADMMPVDSSIYLKLYTGSIFNQADSWSNKFTDNFIKTKVTHELGYHSSGINPEVIKSSMARIAIIEELFLDGATKEDIDPNKIFKN